MSNKKKKYLAAQAAAEKGKRPAPTLREAMRYMLITWLCTAAVSIMVFGRAKATGTPPTVMHYILLGILVVVALAMTEGFFKAKRGSAREDEPEGKRAKG